MTHISSNHSSVELFMLLYTDGASYVSRKWKQVSTQTCLCSTSAYFQHTEVLYGLHRGFASFALRFLVAFMRWKSFAEHVSVNLLEICAEYLKIHIIYSSPWKTAAHVLGFGRVKVWVTQGVMISSNCLLAIANVDPKVSLSNKSQLKNNSS